MADDENSGPVLKLVVCLIAAASVAMIITMYHCISAGRMQAIRRLGQNRSQLTTSMSGHDDTQVSFENSAAELIPAHKYQKGIGLVSLDDGTCAVCLSEFEEGEELRTLPECLHSFHVPCIDMWLSSHSNCPMCRTVVSTI